MSRAFRTVLVSAILFVFFFVLLFGALIAFLGFVMLLRFMTSDQNTFWLMLSVAILAYVATALVIATYMMSDKRSAKLPSES